MEVTKYNYKEALKDVVSMLKGADFISFDLEFSGLGRLLGDKNNDLDTPAARYQKAMKRVREYGLIQFGFTIFRLCEESKKCLSATYCFYLSGKEDGSYRFDSSSMKFLAENGFDFNKLFIEGLSFISLTEEAELRKKKADRIEQTLNASKSTPLLIKDAKAKTFAKDIVQKIKNSQENGEVSLEIEGKAMSSFFRKVLFSNVVPLFPKSHFQSLSGCERNVKVSHFNSDMEKLEYLENEWEGKLSQQLGFTHFIKALLESNLPLIGHNMILDVMHLVDKFIAPLPATLEEFKHLVKMNLPVIYDTKLLAKDPPFCADIPNTSLKCLYEDLTSRYSPPRFEVERGQSSYTINCEGQAHDGGFDAFMTGVCFLTMLKTKEGKHWGKGRAMKSKHLPHYANRINFMWSHDIPFINLGNDDVIPDRSYIFHVSCPSSYNSSNIKHVFSCLNGFKTVWKSSTQFFIIPTDEGDISNAKNLLRGIRSLCTSNVKVEMYRQPKEHNNGNFESPAQRLLDSTEEPVRPSNFGSKRRSDAEKINDSLGAEMSPDSSESSRHLKRLKSVGSELLSNMSLESPMSTDQELPAGKSNNDSPCPLVIESPPAVFKVPDEW